MGVYGAKPKSVCGRARDVSVYGLFLVAFQRVIKIIYRVHHHLLEAAATVRMIEL